ncbi:MAG: AMP-binding protein, partial [Gammaproteobacteria bacterium]
FCSLRCVEVTPEDVFLSFLPLSHTLERTVGYYLPMMAGATVAFTRGIAELAEDLITINPSGLITVPRIFERVYSKVKQQLQSRSLLTRWLFKLAIDTGWRRFEYMQGRAKLHPSIVLWPLLKRLVADKVNERLGSNLKIAISGGAALAPDISRVFIGLGVPILQGYGLTEASPVVSVNRPDNNIPASIGPALPGVEVMIGRDDELLVRGDLVMLGYWNNTEATREAIDKDGWLHTGDKARMEGDFIFITGRLKEIIVLANGEKVPPGDMELAIVADMLIDQLMVIGEARPYLSALVVLNEEQWNRYASKHNIDFESLADETVEQVLLDRISRHLSHFPGYTQIRRVTCISEPWSVDNDLLTPTLKLKRNRINEKYAGEIGKMYEGHST